MLTTIERSATRAAASDYINDFGLATPGLDPARVDEVVAERAATVLSYDKPLGEETTPEEIETWSRMYCAVIEGLKNGNLSDSVLQLSERLRAGKTCVVLDSLNLARAESILILEALRFCGDMSTAANELGITREQLVRKMRKYRIEWPKPAPRKGATT
jgi:DNA-binding NtrC family response regulator